jgi:hypothetical protein
MVLESLGLPIQGFCDSCQQGLINCQLLLRQVFYLAEAPHLRLSLHQVQTLLLTSTSHHLPPQPRLIALVAPNRGVNFSHAFLVDDNMVLKNGLCFRGPLREFLMHHALLLCLLEQLVHTSSSGHHKEAGSAPKLHWS